MRLLFYFCLPALWCGCAAPRPDDRGAADLGAPASALDLAAVDQGPAADDLSPPPSPPPAPPPLILSLSATSGWGGDELTIVGSGLSQAAAVYFDQVAADSFRVVDDRQLVAVVPTRGHPAAGPIRVAVGAALVASPQTFTPNTLDGKKIMPCGDSITYGVFHLGGYRTSLKQALLAAGLTTTFVGSQSTAPAALASDPLHEGHSGYTIADVQALPLAPILAAQAPDVMLLHLGTNDIIQTGSSAAATAAALAAFLDEVIAVRPDIRILVAQIIGATVDTQAVQDYDALIPAVVAARAAHCRLVDLYAAAGFGTPFQTVDYDNEFHPSAYGYDEMAAAWMQALQALDGGAHPIAPIRPYLADLSTATLPVRDVVMARPGGDSVPAHLQRGATTVVTLTPGGADYDGGAFEDFGRGATDAGYWALLGAANVVPPFDLTRWTAVGGPLLGASDSGVAPDGSPIGASRLDGADTASSYGLTLPLGDANRRALGLWVQDVAERPPAVAGSLGDGHTSVSLGTGTGWRRVWTAGSDAFQIASAPAIRVWGMSAQNLPYHGAVKVPSLENALHYTWFKVPAWRRGDVLDAAGDLDLSADHLTEELVATYSNLAAVPLVAFRVFADVDVQLDVLDDTWTLRVGGAAVASLTYSGYPDGHVVTSRGWYKPAHGGACGIALYIDGALVASTAATSAAGPIGAVRLAAFATDPSSPVEHVVLERRFRRLQARTDPTP